MGAVESKVPDEFTTLPAKVQETYRSLFKRLVAAGTTPDLALLELIAIYCAVEDPQAFIAGVDLDGDGSVSTEEIEKVMILAGASKKDAHKAAKAVVHAADVDHDGDLNVHELGVFATPAEVRKAIAAGALVLDVREVVEGAENPDVVPGSLSLPYLHEDEGLSFETAFKQLPILVYSSNGKDAGGAVARLKDLGFSNAANGFNGNHIINALKDGPTAKEMADLEAAEADLLAAKDAYSRAARIAAKAGTTIQVAKLNAKAVGQQAAAAAETTMIAKSDYERAGRVAAKAAATQLEAKAHAKVAGKEAAGAAATILAAKEDHDRTAKIAAKAAATRTHAKEAASHAAVEAAAAAVIKGVAPVAAQ